MTISRRKAWDGSELAVNSGKSADTPDEALHNSAVVGSSNAPVEPGSAAPDPGTADWLEASTVAEVNAWLDENPDERDAVVKLERKRGEHARKGITGD